MMMEKPAACHLHNVCAESMRRRGLVCRLKMKCCQFLSLSQTDFLDELGWIPSYDSHWRHVAGYDIVDSMRNYLFAGLNCLS